MRSITPRWAEYLRTTLALGAVLTVGGLAIGCGQKAETPAAEEKPTLNVWYTTFREDTMKQIVDGKQTENTNLVSRRFSPDQMSWFETRTVDAIAADEAPDVWIIPNDWIPDHLNKIVTVPDDFWNESAQNGPATTTANLKEKYIPAISNDLVEADNRTAGFPGPAQTLVLYRNRTLFSDTYSEWSRDNQKASKEDQFAVQRALTQEIVTWDDFVAATKLITRKDASGNITRAGAALGTASNVTYANDILQLMMYQQGGLVVDSVKRIALFNNYEKRADGQTYYPGKDALTFYNSFTNPNNPNHTWNASMTNSRQAFMEGKVAMLVDYPEFAEVMLQNKTSISYDMKAVPQVYKDRDKVNFARYYVATITKASQSQRLAATLAKTIIIDGGSSLASGWPGSSVPLITTQNSNDVNALQLQTARTVYKRHHTAFDLAFTEMIDDVASRGQTIDNAINRGAERITNILQSE